jgi:hypothetical protein
MSLLTWVFAAVGEVMKLAIWLREVGCRQDRALSALVSLRIAYLAVLRVFSWLALLARSDRAKDAGIRAPRTQLGVAM